MVSKMDHEISAGLRFNFGQGAEARCEAVLIGQFENFVPKKERTNSIVYKLYLEKLYVLLCFVFII